MPKEATYEQIANSLGWFSVGLGVAQLVAPGKVANLVGIRNGRRAVMRSPLYGMRELAAGAGILTTDDKSKWMWGRVAGDVLDLASLGTALMSSRNDRGKVATAMVAVASVTALDVMCANNLSQEKEDRQPSAAAAITVNRPIEEVYGFLRDQRNMPRFMRFVESVEPMGEGRSIWRMRGRMGWAIECECEIVEERTNALIAWRSKEGERVLAEGGVRLQPGPEGRGTIVRSEMTLYPRSALLGGTIAKWMGRPLRELVKDDLRRFKQVIETGEIVKSDASIHRGMHPARPDEIEPRERHEPAAEPRREWALSW